MTRPEYLAGLALARLIEAALPNSESIALQRRLRVSSLTVEARCSFVAVLGCSADDDAFVVHPAGQLCAVVGVHAFHGERLYDAVAWPLEAPDHARLYLGRAPLIGAAERRGRRRRRGRSRCHPSPGSQQGSPHQR